MNSTENDSGDCKYPGSATSRVSNSANDKMNIKSQTTGQSTSNHEGLVKTNETVAPVQTYLGPIFINGVYAGDRMGIAPGHELQSATGSGSPSSATSTESLTTNPFDKGIPIEENTPIGSNKSGAFHKTGDVYNQALGDEQFPTKEASEHLDTWGDTNFIHKHNITSYDQLIAMRSRMSGKEKEAEVRSAKIAREASRGTSHNNNNAVVPNLPFAYVNPGEAYWREPCTDPNNASIHTAQNTRGFTRGIPGSAVPRFGNGFPPGNDANTATGVGSSSGYGYGPGPGPHSAYQFGSNFASNGVAGGLTPDFARGVPGSAVPGFGNSLASGNYVNTTTGVGRSSASASGPGPGPHSAFQSGSNFVFRGFSGRHSASNPGINSAYGRASRNTANLAPGHVAMASLATPPSFRGSASQEYAPSTSSSVSNHGVAGLSSTPQTLAGTRRNLAGSPKHTVLDKKITKVKLNYKQSTLNRTNTNTNTMQGSSTDASNIGNNNGKSSQSQNKKSSTTEAKKGGRGFSVVRQIAPSALIVVHIRRALIPYLRESSAQFGIGYPNDWPQDDLRLTRLSFVSLRDPPKQNEIFVIVANTSKANGDVDKSSTVGYMMHICASNVARYRKVSIRHDIDT
ncbi:hypothetical protein PVAG01_10337 [Phlyctema vagabunda]|uniref:Uncharacterized protein n=1 Tax=Phlyctema vagabunda TaxID=108571 RepID=A0ABR4P5N2_9HELO